MYKLLLRNVTLKQNQSFIRCYSLSRKNHYEVLRLQKNCTDKEIKQAFIKLSKEYHPDKNKDADAQQQFVRIVEAYNVLGKRSSRQQYDHLSDFQPHSAFRQQRTHDYARYSQPKAEYYQEFRRPHQEQKQAKEAYYGGVGVSKIPTSFLLLLCFGIALVGSLFQAFVIRLRREEQKKHQDTLLRFSADHLIRLLEMYAVQKREAIERSRYLAEELDRVRAAAEGKTNEMQTRLLMEKIVNSANPTIATASLGQALANADKEESKEPTEVLPDLDLKLAEMSNFWQRPQPDVVDDILLDDLYRKLRMYIYYYYYGR